MAGKKTAEFMIVNRRSGKALQATGLDNGLVVEQREPVKADAQIWTSVEAEGRRQAFQQGLRQGFGCDAGAAPPTAPGPRPGKMWAAKASCGSWST